MPDSNLRFIVDLAYNVGFGAKKHFATYDIVSKVPVWLSFILISFGIISLVYETFSAKEFSAITLILSIFSFSMQLAYDPEVYRAKGTRLIELYNELRLLYIKAKEQGYGEELEHKFNKISDEYYQISIPNQILFSDTFAHYKFFFQTNIDWIENERKFTLTDKTPKSLYIFIILIVICVYIA